MYVILIHQVPTLQTDGQTDGQTDDMRSQYRALHYSASRGKKNYSASAYAVTLY